MKIEELPGLLELSVPEKILFLEDLWDSIHSQESEIAIPKSHKTELERRLTSPGKLLSLEELQIRINLDK